MHLPKLLIKILRVLYQIFQTDTKVTYLFWTCTIITFCFKYSLLVYLLLFHNKLLNLSIILQLYFPCNYGSIDFFEYRWLRRCIANQIIFPTNSLGSSLICLFLIGRWKGWSFYDNLCFILLALDHVKQSVFLLPLSHVILFLSLLSHIN